MGLVTKELQKDCNNSNIYNNKKKKHVYNYTHTGRCYTISYSAL